MKPCRRLAPPALLISLLVASCTHVVLRDPQLGKSKIHYCTTLFEPGRAEEASFANILRFEMAKYNMTNSSSRFSGVPPGLDSLIALTAGGKEFEVNVPRIAALAAGKGIEYLLVVHNLKAAATPADTSWHFHPYYPIPVIVPLPGMIVVGAGEGLGVEDRINAYDSVGFTVSLVDTRQASVLYSIPIRATKSDLQPGRRNHPIGLVDRIFRTIYKKPTE